MRFQWVCWCLLGLGVSLCLPATGHSNPLASKEVGYPASLKNQLEALHQTHSSSPENLNLLIQLASTYLDAGDDLYSETPRRLEAYQTGVDFAKQALALDQQHAHAHFLYAANLGHIAQLQGVLVSAFLIPEIIGHVEQSLELAPTHAPALHMMGMILDGLPWFLGGDAEGSIVYLERAVAADPHYTHARVNLGKLYLKQGRVQAAKEQLLWVTNTQSPRGVYAWSHHHNPEALSLLKELGPERK